MKTGSIHKDIYKHGSISIEVVTTTDIIDTRADINIEYRMRIGNSPIYGVTYNDIYNLKYLADEVLNG